MENLLEGGIAELEEVKAELVQNNTLDAQAEEAEKLYADKEKSIEYETKQMEKDIESAIKSKRKELEKKLDGIVGEASRNLKDAEKDKKAAKAQAIDSRIKVETAALAEANKILKRENKDLFKQWKLPGFCNTPYYYAMFAAKHGYEFIVFAISVIIAIAVIPNIVCLLVNTTTFVKILIYIGIVVFFILIYFIVLIATKAGAKSKIIEKGRINIDKIRENSKLIKKQSSTIRRDKDEEQYNLSEFDEKISQMAQSADEAIAQKTRELKIFEEETAPSIKAEIEGERTLIIDQMKAEAEELKASAAAKRELVANAFAEFNAKFAETLGNENLREDRLENLIGIMKEGKAATVLEAIKVSRGENE